MRTHIDLFTGLGGFSLAAAANVVRTVCMCEIDEFRREGLKRAWPGIPIVEDIRDHDWSEYEGQVWLLTAGVPCQPASRAGKQGGSNDDRWLWPATIAACESIKPSWALFENPPGILDVGIDGIISGLGSIGYEVGLCSIPATARNAPHRRERIWIVANAAAGERRAGAEGITSATSGYHQGSEPADNADRPSGGDMANSNEERSGGQPIRIQPGESRQAGSKITGGNKGGHLADDNQIGRDGRVGQSGQTGRGESANGGHWDEFVWLPCADGKARRAPDDSIGLADGLSRRVLAALGDSIVWPVAAQIIAAMIAAEGSE